MTTQHPHHAGVSGVSTSGDAANAGLPTTDETPKTIRGYELRECIGIGGFGVVYRAFQPIVEREVAIKVIHLDFADDGQFIRQFDREAHLIAHLEHPFIVPLFDYWRDPSGAYLVMRYYAGGSLRDLLQRQSALPVNQVAEILHQVADGLDTAHRHKVIHRDIKPENILLDKEGNAYIADFGIAKRFNTEEITTGGEFISGTLAYLAPEVLSSGLSSPQSDIYSLGYMAFELLTGNQAYPNYSTEQLFKAHLEQELPTIQSLPDAAMAALRRATAKSLENRYDSARAFAIDFQQGLLQPDKAAFPAVLAVELTNPYKGLRPFEEVDSADFFGREALVQQLLDRLGAKSRWNGFLVVAGPSGSGKSSVIKAGLLPALRAGKIPQSQDWYILTMTPGTHPLQQLRAVLLSIAVDSDNRLTSTLTSGADGLIMAFQDVLRLDHDLLLVIDQFEEVFTLVESEQERLAFLTLLYGAVNSANSPLHVIITLRADFYDRPLLYEDFGALVQARTQFVLPLNAEELTQTISGPARQVGLTISPELVASIIADVRQEPGALPLLQYALTEIFEKRESNRLTTDGYQKIGRIRGALAGRAEQVYSSLTPDLQPIAQQVFMRLVAPGEKAEDTRRRARYSELLSLGYPRDLLQSVLDGFGKYRLLTFDRDDETREPTIEVAHEALLSGWERLRDWLDQNRTDMRLQRLLSAMANDWLNASREESYLVAGSRLAQFEDWSRSTKLLLGRNEQVFLAASIAQALTRKAKEAEETAQKLRLTQSALNRFRIIVAILVVASVAGLTLTYFVLRKSQDAKREAELANSERLSTLAEQTLSNGDSARALELAFQAVAITDPPTDLVNALSDVAYKPGLRRVIKADASRPIAAVAISPDEKYIITASGTVARPPSPRAIGAALSGAPVPGQQPGGSPPSPGGPGPGVPPPMNQTNSSTNSTAGQDSLIVWDASTGKVVTTLQSDSQPFQSMALLPAYPPGSGDVQLITAAMGGAVRLWDISTGKAIGSVNIPYADKITLSASADGQRVLITGGIKSIGPRNASTPAAPGFQIIWDTIAQRLVNQLNQQQAGVSTGALSADGKTAIAGYINGDQLVWDVDSGLPLRGIDHILPPGEGIQPVFYTVAVSADPRSDLAILNVGQPDVYIWNFKTGEIQKQFQAPTVMTLNAVISTDNQSLLITAQDGETSLWNLGNGTREQLLQFPGVLFDSSALSPDLTFVVDGGDDGSVYLWDLTETRVREKQRFGVGEFRQAAFLPDGKRIISFAPNTDPQHHTEQLDIWNIADGKILEAISLNQSYLLTTLAISPDGKYAATGTLSIMPGAPHLPGVYDPVVVTDLRTGKEVQRFDEHGDVVSLAIDPRSGKAGQPYLLLVPKGNDVVLQNIESGQLVRTFTDHNQSVSGVAFSPDGTQIASVGADNLLIVQNTDTGSVIRQVSIMPTAFVNFSPDGKLIATDYGDTGVVLWDAATGKQKMRLSGHDYSVTSCAFSPDGKLAVTGSTDNTAILWDLASGTEIYRYTAHSAIVWQTAFSPDGHSFLSVSNGMILWRVAPVTLDEIQSWVSQNRYRLTAVPVPGS